MTPNFRCERLPCFSLQLATSCNYYGCKKHADFGCFGNVHILRAIRILNANSRDPRIVTLSLLEVSITYFSTHHFDFRSAASTWTGGHLATAEEEEAFVKEAD